MARFEPYSRRELRRRRGVWLRRNALVVVMASGAMLAATVVASAIVSIAMYGTRQAYVLGALHVAMALVAYHLINLAFLAHDRDAMSHVRGAWGEDNTRSELRRAKRRRLIWGWVDSIELEAGDLDHVVVTRRGGLVVLDSKWRSEVTARGVAEMTRDASRAKSRAEGLARTVLVSQRGARHRARTRSLSVTPVVVVWGAAQQAVPDRAVVDGVTFVAGRELLTWLRALDGAAVPKESASEALTQLKAFRSATRRHARTARRRTPVVSTAPRRG